MKRKISEKDPISNNSRNDCAPLVALNDKMTVFNHLLCVCDCTREFTNITNKLNYDLQMLLFSGKPI